MDQWALSDTHIQNLGVEVKARRENLGLSLRQASAEIGVSFNTLARVERGHLPDLDNYMRIARWLGYSSGTAQAESTPDVVARHLRTDPTLPAEAANQIAEIVGALYTALARAPSDTPVHLRAARTFTPDASRHLGELLVSMRSALQREVR